MINMGSNLVEIYNQPIQGRLFAVGDIHGCHTMLMQQLQDLQFDFKQDLLVSVGDIIDRGPESLECFQLLKQPWFKAIRGNHEQLCIEATLDPEMKRVHIDHGGEWLYQLPLEQQQRIVEQCLNLPIILEINHRNKKYGFVHADIHLNDWEAFKQQILHDDYFTAGTRSAIQIALWQHGRIRHGLFDDRYAHVSGIDEIYLGHTVLKAPYQHMNCFFIDTGAGFPGGKLTIKELGAENA